jgi:hypothetical protein
MILPHLHSEHFQFGLRGGWILSSFWLNYRMDEGGSCKRLSPSLKKNYNIRERRGYYDDGLPGAGLQGLRFKRFYFLNCNFKNYVGVGKD